MEGTFNCIVAGICLGGILYQIRWNVNPHPDYINDFGLVNATRADINAENSPLWTVQYNLLVKYSIDTFLIVGAMNIYIMDCMTTIKGLYGQFPVTYKVEGKDKYMSPDQLIAFVCHFKMYGYSKETKLIWKYLVAHYFTYNNQTGKTDFKRLMQPKAILVTGIGAGSLFAPVLVPLLVLTLIWSCVSKPDKTSGKLKAWTIMGAFKMKKTMWLCTHLIKLSKFKTWKAQFLEYFKELESPNRVQALVRL